MGWQHAGRVRLWHTRHWEKGRDGRQGGRQALCLGWHPPPAAQPPSPGVVAKNGVRMVVQVVHCGVVAQHAQLVGHLAAKDGEHEHALGVQVVPLVDGRQMPVHQLAVLNDGSDLVVVLVLRGASVRQAVGRVRNM